MTPIVRIEYEDDAARRTIRTALNESLIVEASAGTGKTSELVLRLVAVLGGGLTTIERIVAVTFTRKAAGELKLRLRQELDRARNRTSSCGELSNLEHALGRLEEARIGTIHSFCAEILRSRPVEALVDPAFEELSEYEAPRLYRRAFRRWFEQKLAESSPGLRRALSRVSFRDGWGGSPMDQLQDAGWKLVEWRDFPAPWTRPVYNREAEIDGLVDEVSALAEISARCTRTNDNLHRALRPLRELALWIERAEAVRSRDYDSLENLLFKLMNDLKRDRKKGSGTFAAGISREEAIARKDRLLLTIDDFRKRAEADLAAILQGEMQDLAASYEDLKRKSGKLDFSDLLGRVRDLVLSNGDVRRHLQRQFTHIFVDEFQDTDPLQLEILLLLASDDPAIAQWSRVTPVPGKLFLVGDPKQSIYRFRRADVQLYELVKGTLTGAGVRVLHLTRSFRAVRPIQKAVNSAFESAMRGRQDYVPLHGDRPAFPGQPSVVALPVPKPFGGSGVTKTAIDKQLPETIVAFAAWLIQESGWKVRDMEGSDQPVAIEARHICLLFRRFVSWGNDVTRDYVRGFEARAIPHLLVGAKSFHRREEVETLRAALTAIEWPDDELSVFATLKGSLFALPDDLLLRFRRHTGALNLFYRPSAGLPQDLAPVVECLGLLQDLHRGRNRRPVVATVHQLLEATRAHAGFAMRPAGHQILANLYRICDLARAYEQNGGISFRGFVEELCEQAEREEGTEAPVFEEGADGVRIMTVHAAKGLEFPIVILADMTAKLASSDPDRYVDPRRGLCAMRLLGCSPVDLLERQDDEKQREEEEGLRVAYVAATRARDLLVVPAIGDEPFPGWLSPLSSAIYPAREMRRNPALAPGCPPFGDYTVLSGPSGDRLAEEHSIKPGLHGGVVWWDPAKLKMGMEGSFGLRQEQILSEDAAGEPASETIRDYDRWKAERARSIEEGSREQFRLITATGKALAPAGSGRIHSEILPRPAGRPSGRRFGTLVHTVLRDVDFSADEDALTAVAQMHARMLGATAAELDAAIQTVAATLRHPLIQQAKSAARCHREFPLVFEVTPGEILEGTVDLAFQTDGIWNIVDFKTDAASPSRRFQYENQLQWYLAAMSRITGLPVTGWLLAI